MMRVSFECTPADRLPTADPGSIFFCYSLSLSSSRRSLGLLKLRDPRGCRDKGRGGEKKGGAKLRQKIRCRRKDAVLASAKVGLAPSMLQQTRPAKRHPKHASAVIAAVSLLSLLSWCNAVLRHTCCNQQAVCTACSPCTCTCNLLLEHRPMKHAIQSVGRTSSSSSSICAPAACRRPDQTRPDPYRAAAGPSITAIGVFICSSTPSCRPEGPCDNRCSL